MLMNSKDYNAVSIYDLSKVNIVDEKGFLKEIKVLPPSSFRLEVKEKLDPDQVNDEGDYYEGFSYFNDILLDELEADPGAPLFKLVLNLLVLVLHPEPKISLYNVLQFVEQPCVWRHVLIWLYWSKVMFLSTSIDESFWAQSHSKSI